MRVIAVVLALGIAAPAALMFAQTPAPAQAPQSKPAPAAPRPQGQTPGGPQQPATPPTAQLPPLFQNGFKYAFVRFDLVARESLEGKRANQEITSLQETRQSGIDELAKKVKSLEDSLRDASSLLSETSRLARENEIETGRRELQRKAEDAQKDIERLQALLQKTFSEKLNPVIERLAKEKQLDMIFNASDSGLVWAQPGMDLTTDVIRALDAGSGAKPAAAAPAPPAAPAATPPAAPAGGAPASGTGK